MPPLEKDAFEEVVASHLSGWTPATTPSNADKLKLYALFKQGTVGDNKSSRPGVFDVAGRAKWDAWASKKGLTKQAAQEAYVAEIARQKSVYKSKL
ncbi:hypothetical protein H310_08748 [Aphanomyces invadans]|uniref:ACB domain-containing protein n=1 Tax=Aphanomyces invadans TaxID=157072 RepID=A0A024TYB7_9STRA|nr:hypothetical protein H310_08748 [Aphanomyces invadans]ETV98631.1 hypothetical protein H310_08748 [Aphanomyces invadans]RHY26085.1 hypothetical protein DYB32_007881 [Aphanomyces invadans]|eukprot:XP_008872828.1 hypothetical protein H310_08748 [Aphanomyces invadans]